MPNNWKTYKLGELVDLKQGLAINKKTKHLLTEDVSEMPLFKINDLINNTVKHYVKSNEVPKQCIAMEDELIYTRTGQVGLIFKGKKGCIHNNCFKIIPDETLISKDYIYWFLRQPNIIEYANNIASGSVQKDLNHKAFKSIEIDLPDNLSEQKAIASILSAIDDKIENNLAINKTLEDMAMALYKHWFVDFEFPCHSERSEESHFASSNTQKAQQPLGYKSAGGEFIDSELGPIPKGWEVKRLDEVTTMFAGGDKPKVFSKEETEDLKIPIYSNGISNEGLYGFTDKARVVDESVTVSARGTIGYVCLRMEPFLPIVRLVTVVPNKEYLSNKYLFLCLKNQNIQGNGTTQQQLTVPDFKETRIIVPNLKIIKDFTVTIDSFYTNTRFNKKENQSLTQLRDALLPKLISGEVRLKEFQTQIETVIAKEERSRQSHEI